MKSTTINLNNILKIKKFIQDVEKITSDVDIVRGRYVVDAKSVMGIFSMDISKPIEVVLHSDKPEEIALFDEIMERYM